MCILYLMRIVFILVLDTKSCTVDAIKDVDDTHFRQRAKFLQWPAHADVKCLESNVTVGNTFNSCFFGCIWIWYFWHHSGSREWFSDGWHFCGPVWIFCGQGKSDDVLCNWGWLSYHVRVCGRFRFVNTYSNLICWMGILVWNALYFKDSTAVIRVCPTKLLVDDWKNDYVIMIYSFARSCHSHSKVAWNESQYLVIALFHRWLDVGRTCMCI